MTVHHFTIAHTIAAATTEQLKKWIEQGNLQPGRVHKSGRVVSVVFTCGDSQRPHHIRLDTIHRLAARAAAARQKPHATPLIQG